MRLKKLKLHNFRCFEDLEVEFHDNLTVIVGVNGSGKTSIMEGAAVAVGTMFVAFDGLASRRIYTSDAQIKAFPIGSTEDIQAQYPVDISATGVIEGKEDEWIRSLNSDSGKTTMKEAKFVTNIVNEYKKRLQSGDSTLRLPIIAYYGTSRLWDYHREKKSDTFKINRRTNGYIDCLDGTANVKLMMNWFNKVTIEKYQRQEEHLGPIPELEAVYDAMEKCFSLVTGYKNVKIKYNLNSKDLDVYYTDENELRMKISLGQLSDGYKGTISLVADIAYRMAILNPQLLEKVLSDTEGIIFIDEIDLHLHPSWQQRVIGDLTSIFPKVQFIVSTHAPAIINSVRSENLIILKNYQIMQLDNQVYGKDVKSVLNEIMGVSERPPEVAKLFNTFYDQLSKKEFDLSEKTLDKIDAMRGNHDHEVAGCRVKLKLERIRGGKQ